MTPRDFELLYYRHVARNAEMMAFHANMKRDPAKRSKPFTPAEFMPKFEQAPQTAPRCLGPEVFEAFERSITEFNG